jgi:hypothetical protein
MDWRQVFSWQKKPDNRIMDANFTSAEEADARILEILRQHGADLSQPRDVVHYLYAPSKTVAQNLAEILSSEGYAVEVRPAANAASNPPYPWVAVARHLAVIDVAGVEKLRGRFLELAAAHACEYDGWEAAAEP